MIRTVLKDRHKKEAVKQWILSEPDRSITEMYMQNPDRREMAETNWKYGKMFHNLVEEKILDGTVNGDITAPGPDLPSDDPYMQCDLKYMDISNPNNYIQLAGMSDIGNRPHDYSFIRMRPWQESSLKSKLNLLVAICANDFMLDVGIMREQDFGWIQQYVKDYYDWIGTAFDRYTAEDKNLNDPGGMFYCKSKERYKNRGFQLSHQGCRQFLYSVRYDEPISMCVDRYRQHINSVNPRGFHGFQVPIHMKREINMNIRHRGINGLFGREVYPENAEHREPLIFKGDE